MICDCVFYSLSTSFTTIFFVQIIGKEIDDERRPDSPQEKYFNKEVADLKDTKEKQEKVKRAVSEPSLVSRELTSTPGARDKHRHRRTKRSHKPRLPSRFGYEIADLDAFLTKVHSHTTCILHFNFYNFTHLVCLFIFYKI